MSNSSNHLPLRKRIFLRGYLWLLLPALLAVLARAMDNYVPKMLVENFQHPTDNHEYYEWVRTYEGRCDLVLERVAGFVLFSLLAICTCLASRRLRTWLRQHVPLWQIAVVLDWLTLAYAIAPQFRN